MDLSTLPISSLLSLAEKVNSSSFPDDERDRRDWLIRVLGESVCRKLGIYRVPDDLVLSVVIPVYNERDTIREILRQVRAAPIPKQIILVDDCSTDGTREILRGMAEAEPDLTVVFHERNRGK